MSTFIRGTPGSSVTPPAVRTPMCTGRRPPPPALRRRSRWCRDLGLPRAGRSEFPLFTSRPLYGVFVTAAKGRRLSPAALRRAWLGAAPPPRGAATVAPSASHQGWHSRGRLQATTGLGPGQPRGIKMRHGDTLVTSLKSEEPAIAARKPVPAVPALGTSASAKAFTDGGASLPGHLQRKITHLGAVRPQNPAH